MGVQNDGAVEPEMATAVMRLTTSYLQVESQPSRLKRLPSSHCSPVLVSRHPSPQTDGLQAPLPLQKPPEQAAHAEAFVPGLHFMTVWLSTVAAAHVALPLQPLFIPLQSESVWQSKRQAAEQPWPVPFTVLPRIALLAGLQDTVAADRGGAGAVAAVVEPGTAQGAIRWRGARDAGLPGSPLGPVTAVQVCGAAHGLLLSQLFGLRVHENWQSGSQPEPVTLFPDPKSHCSPVLGSTQPSPQVEASHTPVPSQNPVVQAVHCAAAPPAWHTCTVSLMTVVWTQLSVPVHTSVVEQSESDWQSNWQALVQPWPVPLTAVPRSHCSGASTMPSPQTCGGITHISFSHTIPVPHDEPFGSAVPEAQAWPGVPFGPVTALQLSRPLHAL